MTITENRHARAHVDGVLIFLVFEVVITVVAIKKFRKLSKIVVSIPGSSTVAETPEISHPLSGHEHDDRQDGADNIDKDLNNTEH